MATVGSNVLTLTDWAKRLDPDGRIQTIVELLSQENPVLQDAAVVQGNLPTGHRSTIRTGLPNVYWRQLNAGVQPSKSKTAQITDESGMLEAYSEVDKALYELNGNSAEFRLSEDMAFLEAMNQEVASTLFYGNQSADPEEFNGLAPRYGDLSAANATNIIDAGGTGADNASMWFVTWDPLTASLFFPKGSMAGLQHEDLGQDTKVNSDGSMYEVLRTHYCWKLGFMLRDWRYCVRIANIDVSNLAAGSVDLVKFMTNALHRLQSRKGRQVIYCNETVAEHLDNIARTETNVQLGMMEWAGHDVQSFRRLPIRTCDALLSTEAQVT